MEDFDLNLVAKKSVKSIFALVSRTFFIQLLAIVASFVLTIYLSPRHFGVFFLVSSLVVFLNYFQDIGLAASLIQKKKNLKIKNIELSLPCSRCLFLFL